MLPITYPTIWPTGVELFVVEVLVAETETPVVVDVASNDADVDGEVLVGKTGITVMVDVDGEVLLRKTGITVAVAVMVVGVASNNADVDVEESVLLWITSILVIGKSILAIGATALVGTSILVTGAIIGMDTKVSIDIYFTAPQELEERTEGR